MILFPSWTAHLTAAAVTPHRQFYCAVMNTRRRVSVRVRRPWPSSPSD